MLLPLTFIIFRCTPFRTARLAYRMNWYIKLLPIEGVVCVLYDVFSDHLVRKCDSMLIGTSIWRLKRWIALSADGNRWTTISHPIMRGHHYSYIVADDTNTLRYLSKCILLFAVSNVIGGRICELNKKLLNHIEKVTMVIFEIRQHVFNMSN